MEIFKKRKETPGINPETVDEISLQKIQDLSKELKTGNFQFSRLRRKWIPKMKRFKPGETEKMRPLDVPIFKDRIVQEAIHIILEAIYEPIFAKQETNMGFRPNRGCHHAITYLKYNGTGCTVAVEGDIESAYDAVDHDILHNILLKRISDMKFLKL